MRDHDQSEKLPALTLAILLVVAFIVWALVTFL
jgi:hypothetical protein